MKNVGVAVEQIFEEEVFTCRQHSFRFVAQTSFNVLFFLSSAYEISTVNTVVLSVRRGGTWSFLYFIFLLLGSSVGKGGNIYGYLRYTVYISYSMLYSLSLSFFGSFDVLFFDYPYYNDICLSLVALLLVISFFYSFNSRINYSIFFFLNCRMQLCTVL